MYLKTIKKDIWEIYEVCDKEGHSPLLKWFKELNPKYKGSIGRMLAIINRVSKEKQGPNLLSTDISHEVDKNASIYEFIAGDLRLLWFYSGVERRVIVCGCQHLKKTRKVNKQEVKRIINIKDNYHSAHEAEQIVYLDDGGSNE